MNYTTINHDARKKISLSLTEYCVADLIYNIANDPESTTPGWCNASKEWVGRAFDLDRATIFRILHRLEEKKVIEWDKGSGKTRATAIWFNTVVVEREAAKQLRNATRKSRNATEASRETHPYKEVVVHGSNTSSSDAQKPASGDQGIKPEPTEPKMDSIHTLDASVVGDGGVTIPAAPPARRATDVRKLLMDEYVAALKGIDPDITIYHGWMGKIIKERVKTPEDALVFRGAMENWFKSTDLFVRQNINIPNSFAQKYHLLKKGPIAPLSTPRQIDSSPPLKMLPDMPRKI